MKSWEVGVALTYLKPKRRRGFINLITLISVSGVALSVAGLIIVVSVMNGFDADIRDKIIGTNAHVLVNAYTKEGIPSYEMLVERIEKIPGVLAASPFYQGQVMIKSRGGVTGVVLQGIKPFSHSKVTLLQDSLKEGRLSALKGGSEGEMPAILMGTELLRNLDLGPDEEVTIFSPAFRMTPAGMMPRMSKARVAGRFHTGYYEYDSSLVYIALEDAQRLFDAGTAVNQIGVRVKDLRDAEAIAAKIQSYDNGLNYWARDWLKLNGNLFKALQIEKMVMFLILGIMVVVAAFGIVATLVMMVMEKQKEIGILRSLGAPASAILRIFMFEGLITGIFGGALGFALGLGVCAFIATHALPIPGGGQTYYIEVLPVSVEMADLWKIAALAISTCLLAALYPARSAARLDPVEAIRYE